MLDLSQKPATVAQVKRRLKASLRKVNFSRIALARDFRWALESINWRYTEYKTWNKFCREALGLSKSTVYAHTRTANHIDRLKYTDEECYEMLIDFSWKHFTQVLPLLSKKLPPAEVAEKFEKFTRTGNTVVRGSKIYERGQVYSFALQPPLSDKLDACLIPLGMTISDRGHRNGLRDAMTKFLEETLD